MKRYLIIAFFIPITGSLQQERPPQVDIEKHAINTETSNGGKEEVVSILQIINDDGEVVASKRIS